MRKWPLGIVVSSTGSVLAWHLIQADMFSWRMVVGVIAMALLAIGAVLQWEGIK